ncbi:MAG: VWA domain-containing protein [Chthoniobacterales bacterium]
MEKTALTFGEPLWFAALVLLPALGVLFFWAQRKREALLARIVAPRLKLALVGSVSVPRRWLKNILLLLSLGFIILSLAQPRYGFKFSEFKAKGRDVIIAMDTSRSMLATDVSPNRLARAKLVALDLVNALQGDRVGLVAFAGSAFLQAPLTLDYSAVESAIEELDVNIIPKGGTNIAASIQLALEAFGKAEGSTRAIILITDGEELDANGIEAARQAKKQGVRIFTVGVGSDQGSLIPVEAETGGTELVRDQMGKVVRSKLDASRLKEIAQESGGFYQVLSSDTARNIIEKGIEPMETKDFTSMASRNAIERYEWALIPGIVLLALALMIGDRQKNGGNGKRQRTAPSAAPLLIAILLVSVSCYAQANPGIKKYEEKDYKSALGNFEGDLKSQPNVPAIQFDAGAAAYQLGDYDKAINYFTKAFLSEDQKLRNSANYNLGNTLVRKGEKAQQKDQKIANWKDAIQRYNEVLKQNSDDARAKHNKEVVEKMLKDLEKEPPPQDKDKNKDKQKQDQQKQDQQKQDQQKQDQQKQDQQKQDQQKQDQQKQDQQKQDQQKQDQQKQDQQKQDQQPQNQQQQNGSGQKPEPTPSPGEKKSGELKSSQSEKEKEQGKEQEKQEQAAAAQAAEEGKEGEMTQAQAQALLRSLQGEEEKVKLNDRQTQDEVDKNW